MCPWAGVALVDAHGAAMALELLPLFEGYLDNRTAVDEANYDLVREGVVVCLGTLARHLVPDDPKVRHAPQVLQPVLLMRLVDRCPGSSTHSDGWLTGLSWPFLFPATVHFCHKSGWMYWR